MSLRTRLALLTSGLTLAGLVLGLTLVYVLLLSRGLSEIDRELVLQSETVLQAALADPANEVPPEVEDSLAQETGVSSMLVFRVGEAVPTFVGGVLDIPKPIDVGALEAGQGISTLDGWRINTLSRDGLIVQVGRPLAPLQASLLGYVQVAIPLALLLGIGAGGLAWGLVGWALRGLKNLTEATRKFEQGAEVPIPRGSDEVATLGHSFRDLLARLRSQRLREQRFLAYAAHELRTPIAAFRANLEAARFKGQLDATSLGSMHREALRLETLAQNLLALSRAEAGEVRKQRVDLADLLAEAFDRFQPLALENGIELELDAQPALTQADPRLLEQALNNLVVNAIGYSEPGVVRLSSGESANEVWLEVADKGPGLPHDLQEGLGLRVAKTVAVSLGGTFEIEGQLGTTARLSLPRFTLASSEANTT